MVADSASPNIPTEISDLVDSAVAASPSDGAGG